MNRSLIELARITQIAIGGTILAGLLFALTSDAHDACPAGMAPTGRGTCIDVYEWPNQKGVKPMLGASALPEMRDIRAGRVMDATALCESVGKRVCSRDEWVSACKGPNRTKYPWGNGPARRKHQRCNTDKHWRPVDEGKVAARDAATFQRLDQSEPSGMRPECKTGDDGPHDMIGNAEEWVECPGVGLYGWCLMGRFWAGKVVFTCEMTVAAHAPWWHYYETGFRCCRDLD